jgi:type IV secretory pathway TrbF-like protein
MSTHTMHTVLSRSVPVPEEAGVRYLEEGAVYKVHNRWLRIALGAAALVIVTMAAAGWKLSQSYANMKPIVVRVNASGDAVTAPYASLEYQPREPEVRHFLMRFVQDHYSRVRATARDAFQRKLFFLGSNLARATMEEESRTRSLQAFLSGNDDEVEVYVTNVAIEDLRQAPYKATVEFDKVFRSAGDGRELKRQKYTAHFVFTLLDQIPNNFIATNPLGMVITYFREDEAF